MDTVILFRSRVFTTGQEIATFLVSCGVLSKACEESRLVSSSESYSLNEYEGVAYVAFPSFHNIEGYIVKEGEYGECNIQTGTVFSACLKGNADQPALVHQGALKLFLHIIKNTDFQAKLQIYTDPQQKRLKPIIFVGNSLGGAVATLATLWVLEKRLRQSSPFCITFGCPLVGDANLVEAIDRENWGGNFCHVVSKNDMVPRMLLAPFESTAKPLNALLPYWWGKITNRRSDQPDSFIQDAYRSLVKSVRSVRESDTSPYKPFGTYMFCSNHGAACIADSQTVLDMLSLTMQSQETYPDNIVQDCLLEHISYGSLLEHLVQISTGGTRIVNSNSESCLEMGISLQLEAIGVGAQDENARSALRSATETENERNTNLEKLAIELSQRQCNMAELEWYKEVCEQKQGETYYDSFKNQNERDIHADTRRVKLAEFWDGIIEKVRSKKLPSDFQSQNKWINAGTTYRRLVEPLDIAFYYRSSSNYVSNGRPGRHEVLQKWMEEKEKIRSARAQEEEKEKTRSARAQEEKGKARSSRAKGPRTKPASLTEDSCFWAYVEEAWNDLENLKQGHNERLQNLQQFEKSVTTMNNALKISSDVFLKGSSFMMWSGEWEIYKIDHGVPLSVI